MKRQLIYNLFIGFYRIYFTFTLRVRAEGTENIPKGGGYILASNHRLWYDPIMLAFKVKEQVRYMAKAELFEKWYARWLWNGIGAFPVDRGNNDTGAMDHAVDILNRGGVLGIFPEGTRSKTQVPLRAKSGMALFVRTAKVGVLPCAVVFDKDVKFRTTITIKYGKFIPYEEMFGVPEGEKLPSLRKVTDQIMTVITDMLELPPELLEEVNKKPKKAKTVESNPEEKMIVENAEVSDENSNETGSCDKSSSEGE